MLAGKVEETPKKCRDIIRTSRELLPPELFATFGNDPRVRLVNNVSLSSCLGGIDDVRKSPFKNDQV